MSFSREPDSLATLMTLEHARVLECADTFVNGARPSVLDGARAIVRALEAAEASILTPMIARLRPQTRDMLTDAVGDRAQVLAALDALADAKAQRARKEAFAPLVDQLKADLSQRLDVVLPALASQLPRVQYRAVVHAFIRHYQATLGPVQPAPAVAVAEPKQQRRRVA